MRWRLSFDLAKSWRPFGSASLESKDNGWTFPGSTLEDRRDYFTLVQQELRITSVARDALECNS